MKPIRTRPYFRTESFCIVCRAAIVTVLAMTLLGCVSVPPQVAKTHQKELEIIESLQPAHLAMVDSYIDQKLENFEHFFFYTYGPVFLSHWINTFKTLNNRDYDENRDFPKNSPNEGRTAYLNVSVQSPPDQSSAY